MLKLTRYQWMVLFAAWLGWGFDVFDSLLFNYVAPNAVPTLLGMTIGSPEAKQATLQWTGILTSILLLGWAAGGVLFGFVADRIGRSRTLLITMLMYAVGTAACAFAPNMEWLIVCRIIASLGIGGEWAAGASMVAEVVPEEKRVEAGALLYTSAPIGLFLATFINMQVAGTWFTDNPEMSWRYVMLFGLIPAAVAFAIRWYVKEPERWQQASLLGRPPRLSELFSRDIRALTASGLLMSLIALVTWWSCNAFLPVIVAGLANTEALTQGLDKVATQTLIETWKTAATSVFNLGGLIGTLLTIPAAKYLGRKKMFTIYFAVSALAIMAVYGLNLPPMIRLGCYFLVGVSVFGVFGSFTYYLPELFPTRLRGTGAGFCYNIGRVAAAFGPLLVGLIAAQGYEAAIRFLFYIGFVPLIGIVLMPWVIETRGQSLKD